MFIMIFGNEGGNTVDGSEIRRSTWDGAKTLVNNGISTTNW